MALWLSQQALHAQDAGWEEISPKLDSWIHTRVTNAKTRKPERVRMPVAVHCTGWGCRCPDTHIGTTPLLQDGPFISLISPPGFPQPDSVGCKLEVIGYFTGDSIVLDMRQDEEEPEEWRYQLPTFQVIKWKKLQDGVPARKIRPSC